LYPEEQGIKVIETRLGTNEINYLKEQRVAILKTWN